MTKRNKKRMLLWSSTLGGIALAWHAGTAVAIARASRPNPGAHADVATVLGAAVWDTRPSTVFAARLDHGAWLFERGQVEQLVFMVGRAEGDRLSEGEAARDYALAKGVPPSAISWETTSASTLGNLSNANGGTEAPDRGCGGPRPSLSRMVAAQRRSSAPGSVGTGSIGSDFPPLNWA
ncbi:YdcF family protein [bacterium]|nr:MAG: YdcF family protein [bacterium]